MIVTTHVWSSELKLNFMAEESEKIIRLRLEFMASKSFGFLILIFAAAFLLQAWPRPLPLFSGSASRFLVRSISFFSRRGRVPLLFARRRHRRIAPCRADGARDRRTASPAHRPAEPGARDGRRAAAARRRSPPAWPLALRRLAPQRDALPLLRVRPGAVRREATLVHFLLPP